MSYRTFAAAMVLQFDIKTEKRLNILKFMEILGAKNLIVEKEVNDSGRPLYMLERKGYSTTMTLIEQMPEKDGYTVFFDRLASYDDYKFLPYLLDSMNMWLTGKNYKVMLPPKEGEKEGHALNAFQLFNNEWIETQIAEGIAYAKSVMSIHLPYFIELPLEDIIFIYESDLNEYGIDLHSSTPRIYGYIQYLLHNKKLPNRKKDFDLTVPFGYNNDSEETSTIEVEVPQHISIGTVQSWHTDGSVTTESFCAQDVALLINIGQRYHAGLQVDGVVLNDLGTIYQEGIGVNKDIDKALEWYKEAIKQGDRQYAPSNIGDIYRKGWSSEGVQLQKALKAYMLGDDPYAWYRIGQAYEEGWTTKPDMDLATNWYKKAAKSRHHLALKRLAKKP